MRSRRFLLTPFPGEGNPAGVTIGGSIARSGDTLSVRFEARGNLSKVSLPAAADPPRRLDRLWEETCFEFFPGAAGTGGYWEVNLSPSGHWNVYRFASYRKDGVEEPAIASLPFDVRRSGDALLLAAEFDAAKIVPAGTALSVAVAAVVKTTDGGKSHWALAHSGPRPDFHRRENFALEFRPGPLQ